jgi:hypothetical protein
MQDRIGAWLDGEDPSPSEVARHVEACPTCAALAEEMRSEAAALEAALGKVSARAAAGAERALAGMPPDRAHAGAPWWSVVLASAASFALAWTLARPGEGPAVKPVVEPESDLQAGDSASCGAYELGDAPIRREVARLLGGGRMSCSDGLAGARLKAMGRACIVPVADWIRASDPKVQRPGRREGAEAIGDIAALADAPLLVDLLVDSDAEVRASAHRGLLRLTGITAVSEADVRLDGVAAQIAWKDALAKMPRR